MTRNELTEYIGSFYSTLPDFPWISDPDSAVFRHGNNKKWFALIMTVSADKIGLDADITIDIVNLKCDPLIIGSLLHKNGVFPAYHMNKEHWITVLLDENTDEEALKMLVDISFSMTEIKSKKM